MTNQKMKPIARLRELRASCSAFLHRKTSLPMAARSRTIASIRGLALGGRDHAGPPLDFLVYAFVVLYNAGDAFESVEDENVKRAEKEHVSLRTDA